MQQFREQIQTQYEKIKQLYLTYERVLMPATLVVGFLVDYFTFTNIDTGTTFALLFTYWVGAGITIAFIHLYDTGKLPAWLRYPRLISPLLLQFFFGALLGGSFIFYWFSGAFSVSWPFMLLLVILMVSNDLFREYLVKPKVQITAYFFVGFSLFSVILPFLFNSLHPLLFVGAGIITTVLVGAFLRLLASISQKIWLEKQSIWSLIAGVLVVMNILYFTNIIPPIPLAIREAGIYHNVTRTNSTYILRGEDENLLQQLIPGQTVHVTPGERIYVFTAIFSPAELDTTIRYRWQQYNEQTDSWADRGSFRYQIIGGRNDGYRGYTWITDPAAGNWRTVVETTRGQPLGIIDFEVERVSQSVPLTTEYR